MTRHQCTIVEDRYPTCSCGSGSWPCRTEKAEMVAELERLSKQKSASAVVDELKRRAARR